MLQGFWDMNWNNLATSSSPDPKPDALRSDEQMLLRNYNRLNVSGKEKALDYVEDLVGNSKYTSDDAGQTLAGERSVDANIKDCVLLQPDPKIWMR